MSLSMWSSVNAIKVVPSVVPRFFHSRETMLGGVFCWCIVATVGVLVKGQSFTQSSVAMSRILNGKVADITDHPYQVALVAKRFGEKRIVCGGVLVKPRVVFTAAHCTHVRDHVPRENIAVLVGANSLDDPDGRIHKIQKVVKHPDFTFKSFDNDFSVVLLKKEVELDDKAQTIPVSLNDHLGGTRATASGWGLTEFGFPSTYLREVGLTVESHSKCQNYFPKIFHPKITRNMICVKPSKGSTYYGDSGGPLTIDGKLVGLVSFGRTVNGNHKTTVFTRVRNFLDFADSAIPPEYHTD